MAAVYDLRPDTLLLVVRSAVAILDWRSRLFIEAGEETEVCYVGGSSILYVSRRARRSVRW